MRAGIRKSITVFLLLILQLGWASWVQAESLSFNLRDQAVRAKYMAPLGTRDLAYSLNFLHHEDDSDFASVGLHLVQKISQTSYLGMGFELQGFEADDEEGAGLGVGGFIRYSLPTMPALAVGGQFYYSPDVIAFSDVDRIWEGAMRIEFRVMKQADIYLGYRRINVEFEDIDDVDIDKGGHLGFRFYF